MNLHKYANIFGAPRTGVHAIRIADIAIVDLILTIAFIYALSYYFPWQYVTTATFIAMFAAHRAFGVKTTTDTWLQKIGI